VDFKFVILSEKHLDVMAAGFPVHHQSHCGDCYSDALIGTSTELLLISSKILMGVKYLSAFVDLVQTF